MSKLSLRTLSTLVMLAFIVGCTTGTALDVLNGVLPSTPYKLTEDVPYGLNDRQSMDIYHADESNGVTVIFVYGGAWRTGNKADYEFVAHALTRRGYNVVIPDYRLYPQVIFPSFVTDVADAVKQYEQSEIARTDERFVLMGHSSGAHTVALLATKGQYLAKANVTTPISALIGLAGPYNLPLDNPEVAPVFPNVKDVSVVNPTETISGNLPPVLLMHGEEDERVLIKHTYTFADAIRKSGNAVSVHAVSSGHAGVVLGLALPLRFMNDSFDHLADFLDELLLAP